MKNILILFQLIKLSKPHISYISKIRPDNFEEIISLAMKSYINYK